MMRTSFEPNRCARRPADETNEKHQDRIRQQHDTGLRDRRTEPVSSIRGRLQEHRQESEHRVHRDTEEQGDEVGGPHRTGSSSSSYRSAGSRCGAPRGPRQRRSLQPQQQTEHRGGPPTPRGSPADGDEQLTSQPDINRAAPQLIRPGAFSSLSGTRKVSGDSGDTDHDQREPKQPVVTKGRDDGAGENDANAGAHRGKRSNETDRAADLHGGELVANDSERKEGAPRRRALDNPGNDDDRQ